MYVNKPEIALKETFFSFLPSVQPSDALKSLHPNSFAKKRAFVLSTVADIGMLQLLAFTSHL